MHKTFISYHHDNEQEYKEDIIKEFGEDNFIDKSVGDGEIDTDLDESSQALPVLSSHSLPH